MADGPSPLEQKGKKNELAIFPVNTKFLAAQGPPWSLMSPTLLAAREGEVVGKRYVKAHGHVLPSLRDLFPAKQRA